MDGWLGEWSEGGDGWMVGFQDFVYRLDNAGSTHIYK